MAVVYLSKYEETFNSSLHNFPILPEGTFYPDKEEGMLIDHYTKENLYGIFRVNYMTRCSSKEQLYFHTYKGGGNFVWGDRQARESVCFLFGATYMEYILETNEEFIFKAEDIKERIWGKFTSVGAIKMTFTSLYNECGTIWGVPEGSRQAIIIGCGWKLKLEEFCEPTYLGRN